jgi:hypothetical protein
MKIINKCYTILVLLVLLSIHSGSNKEIEEYNAKALFIYNFTKYIEWQGESDFQVFTIGVYKKSDILDPLKAISSSKKIQNKKIIVKQINESNENTSFQILFLPDFTSKESYVNLLKNLPRKNLLIISESKKLFDSGTGINFLIQENKIKFEINLSSIENAELKISSQLLKLATRVKKE